MRKSDFRQRTQWGRLSKDLVFGAALGLVQMASAAAGLPTPSELTVLVPGFEVREIPVRLPNVNNLRFAPDGSLTALGYNGRIWRLVDSNRDGLEDKVIPFWEAPTLRVPVGMAWTREGLVVSSHGKVSLLRDQDSDGKADVEEVLATGWPRTDVASGGVDATAVTADRDGNLYFGLLTADYSNPYRIQDNVSRYDLKSPRGTIQKWHASTRRLELVASGIRVPYALAFNRAGDLFLTDQEGETWCPGGNPLDELNHIRLGRNYGFPPRHDRWLPGLASEEPVVGFGPQHQSACGLVFNDSPKGKERFGPSWWEGDAFVAGESRGKIWRVKLVKTASGYVGKETIFARSSMLVTDVAISPRGELYVSAHSGEPDWGTGPNGIGKLFKIIWRGREEPQPVAIWASGLMELSVAFDRAIDARKADGSSRAALEFGAYARAADRLEVLKPPYRVVRVKESTSRGTLPVLSGRVSPDRGVLMLGTGPQALPVHYALRLPWTSGPGSAGTIEVDLDYTLNGVEAKWYRSGEVEPSWSGWFPHLDDAVNRAFLGPALGLKPGVAKVRGSGRLELSTALRLAAATNRLTWTAREAFEVEWNGKRQSSFKEGGRYRLELMAAGRGPAIPFKLIRSKWDGGDFHGQMRTDENPEPRPVPMTAFQLPWAPRFAPKKEEHAPEGESDLTSGDSGKGRELFFGERLKCATCHRIRGEGGLIGVDLSNLEHRDPGTVLRDILDPSATIHPDYVAYDVETLAGEVWQGFVRAREGEILAVVTADGKEHAVSRSEIKLMRPSEVSLMPAGLLQGLDEREIRDLMTFVLRRTKGER